MVYLVVKAIGERSLEIVLTGLCPVDLCMFEVALMSLPKPKYVPQRISVNGGLWFDMINEVTVYITTEGL